MSRSFAYGDKNFPDFNSAMQKYIMEKLGREESFSPAMTMGVLDDGKLIAAVVFYNYLKEYGTIQISVASESRRWLTRKVIKEIARLAFEVNGCQTLHASCSDDNDDVSRVLCGIGFKKIVLPNMCGKGRDEIFFCLSVDEWNSLEISKNGNIT